MNVSWQREQCDFFRTRTRFGLPFVPPMSDGTGPLGLIFVIVRFSLTYSPHQCLQKIIKIV